MTNILIVSLGVVCFIITIASYPKLLKLMTNVNLKSAWLVMLGFVISFTLGYALFIYLLLFELTIENIDLLETIVSLIFFLGAVFVVLSTQILMLTIEKFNNLNQDCQQVNDKLEKLKDSLDQKVRERTAQLERISSATINRESKMLKLKKELDSIKKKLND